MRKLLLSLSLVFAAACSAAAQVPYTITGSIRLPAESYVGDPVELRFTIRSESVPSVAAEVNQPRWGTVSDIRVQPSASGFELRMIVVPFEPGTLTVPPIDFGAMRVQGLSLVVNSILAPGETGLRSALGPQRLPGTRAALLLYGIGASFLIALAIYLVGPGRRHILVIVARHRAGVPYRRLLACIQTLENDIRQFSMRDFYIELNRELQSFMSSRIGHNCLASTSTELIGLLPALEASCGARNGITGPLEEVLRAADGAKFAHKTVRRKKRLHHLKLVRAVAVELETHRRSLQRRGRRKAGEGTHVGS